MEQQEPNYMKGFNDGYKLKKYSPELYTKLEPSLNESDNYERGILEGAKEIDKEKEADRMADLKQIRDTKDRNQDKQQER